MQSIQAHNTPTAWSGIFSLPRLQPEIPLVLTRSGQRALMLARFVRAAQEIGVPLPEGNFASIEQVAAAQWQSFISTSCDPRIMDLLAGAPRIEVTDQHFRFWVDARSNLNVFQEKPVIEALESAKAGLGWYVHDVITGGHGHGLGLYDIEVATYYGMPYHYHEMDEFTDREYARWILQDEGRDPSELTDELLKDMRGDYTYWPSDILETLGGHGHLMRATGFKHPKCLKQKDVRAWLARNRRHHLAAVVDAALRLDAEWGADKERTFCFSLESGGDSIGAPAFLTWDDPDLLVELIQHHEETIYNGGEGYEAFAVATLSSDAPDRDLRELALASVSYFKRWALLAECLSHFPVWEGDET